jgi:hypothetical protein
MTSALSLSQPADPNSTSEVIDLEAKAQSMTVDRIAAMLLQLAREQSVRTLEALASTIVNSLDLDRDNDQPFPLDRVRLLKAPGPGSLVRDPTVDMCRRIAMRALRGTLPDPTGGATIFHRIEESPLWSKGMNPVAIFGPFLFYRD